MKLKLSTPNLELVDITKTLVSKGGLIFPGNELIDLQITYFKEHNIVPSTNSILKFLEKNQIYAKCHHPNKYFHELKLN